MPKALANMDCQAQGMHGFVGWHHPHAFQLRLCTQQPITCQCMCVHLSTKCKLLLMLMDEPYRCCCNNHNCCCCCCCRTHLYPHAMVQTPLIMTAIQTNSQSVFIGPGIWMTCMAVVTVASCLIMLKKFPATNK